MALLDELLAVLAPNDCLMCGHEGSLICAWCMPDAFTPLPSRCYGCRRLTTDFSVCERCRRHSPLKHVWVRAAYEETAKRLVHDYKFARVRSAAIPIAQSLDDVLPYLSPETLLVPVPTATSRIRSRGYDHAALLARQLARQRSVLWAVCMSRLSQSRQVGASKQQRHTQLEGTLLVTKPDFVRGASIILVDDIVTTGATLEALARLLKQAGARSVDAVVFAQKQ